MDILNSTWLIKMLDKSSPTPHGRLLSLFDILEDWLEAPNVAPSIQEQLRDGLASQAQGRLLQDFLTAEATKAGAAMPEMLANQLYFMALAAAQERLHGGNHASLSHAKSAAKALIAAQTKKEFHIAKSSAYAIAASFIGVLVIAGSVFLYNFNAHISPKNTKIAFTHALLQPVLASSELASPQQTATLIAQIELMRKGNCQLIEALQLPDSYKKVYFENIVLGQISTNLNDQRLVNELLQKVRCSYTPMLMANSKS
jgi:hypothetical protein